MSGPFVSGCCKGERCFCGDPAEHKVEETIFPDDPLPHRHPLTTYLCHEHFRRIMGPAADRPGDKPTYHFVLPITDPDDYCGQCGGPCLRRPRHGESCA